MRFNQFKKLLACKNKARIKNKDKRNDCLKDSLTKLKANPFFKITKRIKKPKTVIKPERAIKREA